MVYQEGLFYYMPDVLVVYWADYSASLYVDGCHVLSGTCHDCMCYIENTYGGDFEFSETMEKYLPSNFTKPQS